MPQILRNIDDTLNVTVDTSNASYPTLVALPAGPGEVWVSPLTNIGRIGWDSVEGATATHTFPVAAGTIAKLAIPTGQEQTRRRHVMTLKIGTVLADGDTITFYDGSNTAIVAESNASNDGLQGSGTTEIGSHASTAATQATGLAALINAGTIYIRAEVDAEDTTAIVLMGETAAARITISSTLTTGVITVVDYGTTRPILAVLSASTSTVVSLLTTSRVSGP